MSESQRSIQESLLQSYRQIFIGSQSFILAVGAIVLDSGAPSYLLPLLTLLGLYMIWGMWVPVVIARAKFVDYYKLQSNRRFKKLVQDLEVKAYVAIKETRYRINRDSGQTNWGPTRLKVDFGLPVIFSSIWLLLLSAACEERQCIEEVLSFFSRLSMN